MTHTPPPAGFDLTALGWAGLFALLFSLSRIPERRRREKAEGKPAAAWWEILLETVLGGLIGGVVFTLALPEISAIFQGGRGKQAALAVAGAALGPYIAPWLIAWAPKEIKKRFGVDVEGEGGGDDVEKKG